MRILQIEIHDIRGIRSLLISPKGRNVVVWGPNGSGKSAVVDAIDFLLTGHVSRLQGKGAGGLSLAKHGPHIDSKPENAIVTAILQIHGLPAPVQVSRCMSNPDYIQCPDESRATIEAIFEVAKRGQHVLSRREILRFITSEGSTRADDIQDILSLSDIEEIRKALVKVRNDADKDLDVAERAVSTSRAAITVTLGLASFDVAIVVSAANTQRAVLGAPGIPTLESKRLKQGVTLPKGAAAEQSVNIALLERDFENVIRLLTPEAIAERLVVAQQFVSTILALKADPQSLKDLSKLQLMELGLGLIDYSGACPLCETQWPRGELKKALELRIGTTRQSARVSADIKRLSARLRDDLALAVTSLPKLLAALSTANLGRLLPLLSEWTRRLEALQSILSDPIARNMEEVAPATSLAELQAPEGISEALNEARKELRRLYPATTPDQTAWDTLTRLEENLKAFELANSSFNVSTTFSVRAHALHDAFLSARDGILGDLYDSIAARFSELYRDLHDDDEGSFNADLRPEGAALNFSVDFYGRGPQPPHALHSEGHQDSMGLCLYLALSERLNRGTIDLTILDDVVMSVDADHRRKLCGLIASHFPDRQFLITTHDKTWAHQLRREGIVDNDGLIEFYNWSLATGPHVCLEMDIWPRIQTSLASEDVPSAASLLRRGSEEYFAYACDLLEAEVKYRLDGRNDLGDYMPAAVGRLRELLRKAKTAAKSWSQVDVLASLSEIETRAIEICKRVNVEQWAINVVVHFNALESLTPGEFLPVAQAFQDLYAMFTCSQCHAMLYLTKDGYTASGVRCNCGNINWNLVPKS
jgi:energy-coupling factor transporter ATP-binding protein EcfA2